MFWVAVKERRRVGQRLTSEKSVNWWRILTWLWIICEGEGDWGRRAFYTAKRC